MNAFPMLRTPHAGAAFYVAGGRHRHRRGALHLRVGPRFPPEIPAARRGAVSLPRYLYGLTATATTRAREDIQKTLRIAAGHEFIGSFNRPNLFLEVAPKTSPLKQTLDFLRRYPNESGIIYCFSRQQADELAATLERKGCSVRPYHAGLSEKKRSRNQEIFIRDDVQNRAEG
jgi:superfamily II DNA helicase RecQ